MERPGTGQSVNAQRCIEELLDAFPSCETPRDAIREAARLRLEQARALGLTGPPFCPHVLASLVDIRTRPFRLLPHLDAVIVPDEHGNLTILWNDARPRKRTNFSVAHELGHTLFPSCARMVESRQRHSGGYHGRDEIEMLCDVAAAELLMPYEEFHEDLSSRPPSMATVLELSDRYQASYEAVAIRMQHIDERPLAIFVAEQQARMVPPRLRVAYSPSNEAFAASFPKVRLNALEWIPAASRAYAALELPIATPLERDESWRTLAGEPRFSMEAIRLPVPEHFSPRVLVLLRPAPEPS